MWESGFLCLGVLLLRWGLLRRRLFLVKLCWDEKVHSRPQVRKLVNTYFCAQGTHRLWVTWWITTESWMNLMFWFWESMKMAKTSTKGMSLLQGRRCCLQRCNYDIEWCQSAVNCAMSFSHHSLFFVQLMYKNNLDCRWFLKPLKLFAPYFTLEFLLMDRCESLVMKFRWTDDLRVFSELGRDVLYVYDGRNMNAPMLAKAYIFFVIPCRWSPLWQLPKAFCRYLVKTSRCQCWHQHPIRFFCVLRLTRLPQDISVSAMPFSFSSWRDFCEKRIFSTWSD